MARPFLPSAAFFPIVLALLFGMPHLVEAKPPRRSPHQTAPKTEDWPNKKDDGGEGDASRTPDQGAAPTTLEDFSTATADADSIPGLFTLHRFPDDSLAMEVKPDQLNQYFMVDATLDSGIGDWFVYRGLPLRSTLFQFRKLGKDRLQMVVPNFYFRTLPNDPQAKSVADSFSDSVLYTLPIISINPENESFLIDVTGLFAGDGKLADLYSNLPPDLTASYAPDYDNVYLEKVQAFPENVEIQLVQGFSGSGDVYSLPVTLPDPGSFNLKIHFSLKALPLSPTFKSRIADDRVGYFISAYQNLSLREEKEPFIRYINRWDLQKVDPQAKLSPPKKPITFWIENTVPEEYREPIREGILEWNSAFEKIGFKDAIEAKQMPANADWDPADTRYNTIRWFHGWQSGLLGMGPSSVNPLTGEILSADIIINGDVVRLIRQEFDLFHGGVSDAGAYQQRGLCMLAEQLPRFSQRPQFQMMLKKGSFQSQMRAIAQIQSQDRTCLGVNTQQQLAMASVYGRYLQGMGSNTADFKAFTKDFLRMLVAHEVGHTLGLRHNFRGSAYLTPEELQNSQIVAEKGLTASIMDYLPINLVPNADKPSQYLPTKLGPYDDWAIAYGYQPFNTASPLQEKQELAKIANRAGEPGLLFGADEDSFVGIDPEVQPYDLSSNPLGFAREQLAVSRNIWQKLNRYQSAESDKYSDLRQDFELTWFHFASNAFTAANYIGGQTFRRVHPDSPTNALPLEPLDPEKQRQALALLNQYVFAPDAFQFSGDLLNQLVPSVWEHWGTSSLDRPWDYPIYQQISDLQSFILGDLLDAYRLEKVTNVTFKNGADKTFTLAELMQSLQNNIWQEVQHPQAGMTITTTRRSLQRHYVDILIGLMRQDPNLAFSATSFSDFLQNIRVLGAPPDAQILARYQLRQLQGQIKRVLDRQGGDLDLLSRAHLADLVDRINEAMKTQTSS